MTKRKRQYNNSLIKITILFLSVVSFQFAVFPLSSTALAGIEYARIKGSGAELKSRPGLKTDTIVVIKKGEVVRVKNRLEDPEEISGVSDRWYFVEYKGISGWIFGTSLNLKDPDSKKSYVDVKPFIDRMNEMYEMKEAGDLNRAVALADGIAGDMKSGFTDEEIRGSKRLNEIILAALTVRGECLVYLKRFEEAKEAYSYILKNYPNARLEQESISASEIVGPYLAYIERFSEAVFFSDPKEGLERLKKGLEKKDITAVSELAIPGIFEIWVANTDWLIKLGDDKLKDLPWLKEHWNDDWKVLAVEPKFDEEGKVIGYCINTGPWSVDYSGRPVDSIDFCIDRLPGGDVAFGYLVLYAKPISD